MQNYNLHVGKIFKLPYYQDFKNNVFVLSIKWVNNIRFFFCFLCVSKAFLFVRLISSN